MVSSEIRKKIITEYNQGKVVREIAQKYGVCQKTVYNMVKLQRLSGDVITRPWEGGRKSAVTPERLEEMRSLILTYPDITLRDIKAKMQLNIGRTAIHYLIKEKLGYMRKSVWIGFK